VLDPISASASVVPNTDAATIADSAAMGNDGHASTDDDESNWDSDDGIEDGNDGGCSSDDDGWESEDEEELLLAAMAASGGMISPSVSNDSLTSTAAEEDRQDSLRDGVSRAPVLRRVHLQLSGLSSSTTPCDVVFGDGGSNMSLVLVCKAAQMTGVTPRGARYANLHYWTVCLA
jgi:hypothetical protein